MGYINDFSEPPSGTLIAINKLSMDRCSPSSERGCAIEYQESPMDEGHFA
jgi:hypothetical protein